MSANHPFIFLPFLFLTAIITLAVYLSWTSSFRAFPSGKVARPGLRLIAFGILWFFITLSVESSVIPIKDVIMEHRLYLPSFGAAAAFSMFYYLMAGRFKWLANSKLLFLGPILLVLVLGFATYKRNHVWGDTVRLWQDTVSKSSNKARAYHNLGIELDNSGRRPEAINALSKAIAVDPYYHQSYYNLADLYLISDQPLKAIPLLQAYIRLKPDETKGYVALGAALMRGGQFRELVLFLEQNLDRIKENAEAHFYLGAAHAFLGNRDAAIKELAIISRLDAEYAASLAGLLGLKSKEGFPHGR